MQYHSVTFERASNAILKLGGLIWEICRANSWAARGGFVKTVLGSYIIFLTKQY
jgi:hypothetical protein